MTEICGVMRPFNSFVNLGDLRLQPRFPLPAMSCLDLLGNQEIAGRNLFPARPVSAVPFLTKALYFFTKVSW